jgi:hypothetical protein
MVSSFSKLVGSHAKINGNFWVTYIFENEAFTGGEHNKLLDKNFFGRAFYEMHKEKICGLRLIDCYNNDIFKTQGEFATMNFPVQTNTWLLLRGACKKAISLYKKQDPLLDSKRETLLTFIQKQKKGSKKIRKILSTETENQSRPGTLRIVESFARITENTVPAEIVLNHTLSVWNLYCFTNDFREFLFKQRNNLLGVGARVAHFDDEVDERCTFCRILYPPTRTREDFIRLFRTCPITVGLIQNLIRLFRL